MWDIATGKIMKHLCHSHPVHRVCLSSSERYVASIDSSDTLSFWDLLSHSKNIQVSKATLTYDLKVDLKRRETNMSGVLIGGSRILYGGGQGPLGPRGGGGQGPLGPPGSAPDYLEEQFFVGGGQGPLAPPPGSAPGTT